MKFAVMLQCVVALIMVAVCGFGFGRNAAISAMYASIIAIMPNALFAVYLSLSPKPAEYRFFVGEGIKIVVALVAATVFWWKYGASVQPFAYWVALIMVLKAHNFGLLRVDQK